MGARWGGFGFDLRLVPLEPIHDLLEVSMVFLLNFTRLRHDVRGSCECCHEAKESRKEERRLNPWRSGAQNLDPCSPLNSRARLRKGKEGRSPGRKILSPCFRFFVFYRNLRIGSQLCTLLDLCVSSLPRGHANLLCIVSIVTDDSRRKSCGTASQLCTLLDLCVSCSRKTMLIFSVSFQS
jgi:hypothetical protein